VTSDAERVRASYDALNRGDVPRALEVLAPRAEWHESEALPDTGTYIGREAIGEFLDRFLESWERFQQEVEDVVEEGDRVVVLIHLSARGKGSGAEVDARYAHLWTLRDGLGVRVDAYYDRNEALSALRANPTP
jgi:uncharacterized protein